MFGHLDLVRPSLGAHLVPFSALRAKFLNETVSYLFIRLTSDVEIDQSSRSERQLPVQSAKPAPARSAIWLGPTEAVISCPCGQRVTLGEKFLQTDLFLTQITSESPGPLVGGLSRSIRGTSWPERQYGFVTDGNRWVRPMRSRMPLRESSAVRWPPPGLRPRVTWVLSSSSSTCVRARAPG